MFAINYNAAANSSKKTTAVISVKTITSNIGKKITVKKIFVNELIRKWIVKKVKKSKKK